VKQKAMLRPAVFLDLDGTLVLPVQADSPNEYERIRGAAEWVHLLNKAGFLCPVITGQSRIAKGVYFEEALLYWFRGFQADMSFRGRRGAWATCVTASCW
jgi:histidinol phosphatase-like enzyme